MRRSLSVVVGLTMMWGGAFASDRPIDLSSTSLIVKFERDSDLRPERVVDLVDEVAATQGSSLGASDWSLFARLGSPLEARWLIQHRIPSDHLDALLAEDPEHPEIHLQEYVLLRYADTGTRMLVEGRLVQDKSVRSAVPDRSMSFNATINDHYANTAQSQSPQGYQWALAAITAMSPWNDQGAPSAWDKVTGFGYVTVIDTGIQRSHLDLQGNFRPHFSQAFYSFDCVGNSLVEVDETGGVGNTCPPTSKGHGTHVAGIIAATTNNGIGVGGVCRDCSLIIAKVSQRDQLPASNVVNGLYHAVIRGSQAANFSGGFEAYLGSSSCALEGPGGDAFCDAIAFARKREMLFVASTGNQNYASQSDFPAEDPDVVAVAATNSLGGVWWNGAGSPPFHLQPGSNLGIVTFVAPGARVVSTFYEGASWNNTCNDQGVAGTGYDECTGTSMASPHVTASLTMIRSVNPLATNAAVVSLVTSTATNVPRPSSGPAYKMPNLYLAVNQAISNGFLWPAFAMVTKTGQSNRFTTVFPQMARASIGGTMLPTLIAPETPVEYLPDTNAAPVSGYAAFPDSTVQPRAYFKVYTRLKVSQTKLRPLYRLSKLQNLGNGRDQCGNLMPVPAKQFPVLHTYATNKTVRDQLMGSGAGQCFKYDGIEGYVAPSNLGGLQELFQLYNPSADSFILVPSSKVSVANGMGYVQNQTSLGWVVPN